MIKTAQKEEDGFWDRFADAEAEAYRFAVEKGMQVREIEPGDLRDWRICSSDLLEHFVDKMGEDGTKLMSAYGKLKQAQCCNAKSEQAAVGR
jgi:hypothetical protein